MNIEFQSVSKRYAYEWIFRDVSYTINSGDKLGIIGPNGSGKSTFLRVLLGTVDPSKGKVLFSINNQEISAQDVFSHFSFTAPYMGIPDNLTLEESLRFHFKFREIADGMTIQDIADLAYLSNNKQKSRALILDEPTTNLDEEGKAWFQSLLKSHLNNRTLVIATNEKEDLALVDSKLNIMDYKKNPKKSK